MRVAVFTSIPDIAGTSVRRLRRSGADPAGIVRARWPAAQAGSGPLWADSSLTGVDTYVADRPAALEGIVNRLKPDVILSWAFPWRIPNDVLSQARLGAINFHPSLLSRHRGPNPVAWTVRAGDSHYGVTWHRMVAELDRGPILDQRPTPVSDTDTAEEVMLRLATIGFRMLPSVLDQVASGCEGVPQSDDDATYAPPFGEDYAVVDWDRAAADVHRQVLAWSFTPGSASVPGPFGIILGRRHRILRTCLDPVPGAHRIQCLDRPIWVTDSRPE